MRIRSIIAALWLLGACGTEATVLVWDHDNGRTFKDPKTGDPVGTESGFVAALAANGVHDVETKHVLPYDLGAYEAVFVLCGFWPDDGRLSYREQQILESYLASGAANLYLEGTDIACRFASTPLFDKLGTGFADDGRTKEEGNVNVAEGIGSWAGIRLDYYAYRKDDPDAYVDELVATKGEAVIRSRRAGNQSNARVVRYAPDGDDYRAVVSSMIFGALKNGKYTKKDLMERYLTFFGITGNRRNVGLAPASLGRVRALFR